eukprot:PLAT6492.1.p1 GENE.PLAT6492.1~~PLAT6492.1.p1  ORF type:complete len:259 (+),score=50.61 PLAT6492.1:23-778(+)
MEAEMHSGQRSWYHFNALQGFWPGLQAQFGDVAAANATLYNFFTVWASAGFPPERVDLLSAVAPNGHESYPLRPELLESAFHLHHATGDASWQRIGAAALRSLRHCRTSCGYAAVRSVKTGELMDQMDSYFLAETAKYLYLLFDDRSFVRSGDYVFNTEGHLFPRRRLARSKKAYDDQTGSLAPQQGKWPPTRRICDRLPAPWRALERASTCTKEDAWMHMPHEAYAEGRVADSSSVLAAIAGALRSFIGA